MGFQILLLDTETNGLPKRRDAPPSEHWSYPAILQIAWTILEDNRIIKSTGDIPLLLPADTLWDAGAARIHGVREENARNPLISRAPGAVIAQLSSDLHTVQCVVSHNLAFDKAVILATAYRSGLDGGAVWGPADSLQDVLHNGG